MVLTHLVHGIANSSAQSLMKEPQTAFSVRKSLIFVVVNEAIALVGLAYHGIASAKYILHVTAYILHLTVREPQSIGGFCYDHLRPFCFALYTSIRTPKDCLFANDKAATLQYNAEQIFGPRPIVKISSPFKDVINLVMKHRLPITQGSMALIGATACFVAYRVSPSFGSLGRSIQSIASKTLSLWAPPLQTAEAVIEFIKQPTTPNIVTEISTIEFPAIEGEYGGYERLADLMAPVWTNFTSDLKSINGRLTTSVSNGLRSL